MSKNFLTEAYQKLRRGLRRGLSYAEEDALNDAFGELWAARYEPQTAGEGERLLYAAFRNRRISLWRRARSHPSVPLRDVQIADPPPADGTEELLGRIMELVKSELTPLQQDILTRHDINLEPYQDIAAALGMQEPAVRMQLSRARRKIREVYKSTTNH